MLLDVSEWEQGDQSLGTSEGYWIIQPDSRLHGLLKFPKRRADGVVLGHVWAEIVAMEMGRCVGVPVAQCRAVTRHGRLAVLSSSVTEANNELKVGADFGLDEHPATSLEMVLQMFVSRDECHLEHGLREMLLFDYLIGLQDRHPRNWGILVNADGGTAFSPLFDNASCLGSEMGETAMTRLLESRDSMERWVRRWQHYFTFQGKPITWEALKAATGDRYEPYRQRLDNLRDGVIDAIISQIEPEAGLTPVQGQFVGRALKFRRDMLLGR